MRLPYFMDRHDMPPGVTPEEVVAYHLKDLAIQHQYGVHYRSYWFDPDRDSVFCLVEAPSEELAIEVHRNSHGEIGSEIIPVDRNTAARFLGRIDDPAGPEAVTSAFRTILFTDMADSTSLTQRLGDEAAMRLLRSHDSIIRTALHAHEGREVKHTGDGIMASFEVVSSAITCSIAVQDSFGAHNDTHPDTPISVRIGVSAGEPVTEANDLFGAAVQLAARICDYAEPGSVYVSGAVAELAVGKQFAFGTPLEVELKGFDQPVRVAQVLWESS